MSENEIVKEIEQLVRMAVLAEREACARIAMKLMEDTGTGACQGLAIKIAATIRDRDLYVKAGH